MMQDEGTKMPDFPGYGRPVQSPGQNRDLSPATLAAIAEVRTWRAEGIKLLHLIGNTSPTDPVRAHRGPFGSADLALAMRSVMRAESNIIFALTGGPIDQAT